MTVARLDDQSLEDLSILQVVAPNTLEARPGLASNIYIAAADEFPAGAFNLPGQESSKNRVV